MTSHESVHAAPHAEVHPHPNYIAIFIWLVVLTGASFLTFPLRDQLSTAGVAVWVLAIAVSKATLVAMFFMHLKFEGRWKFVLVIPPLVMSTLLVLALVPDILIGMK